jgi:hypothetical protein
LLLCIIRMWHRCRPEKIALFVPVVTVASYPKSGGARLKIAARVRSPDALLAGDDLRSHARAALMQAGRAVAA